MPWSIFSDGGGQGVALTWAIDLLRKIGAPLTNANEQFVYDWERSEGGGGRYNPLNEGPVPGHPELTSTGQQYGGGAADYVSWSAGITGAADYLAMPNFRAIADDLRAGDAAAARQALIASPWAASHYGGGAAFSTAAAPGKAQALPGGLGSDTGSPSPSSTGGGPLGDLAGLAQLPQTLKGLAVTAPLVIAGGALIVWGLARATGVRQKAETVTQEIKSDAGTAASVGVMA